MSNKIERLDERLLGFAGIASPAVIGLASLSPITKPTQVSNLKEKHEGSDSYWHIKDTFIKYVTNHPKNDLLTKQNIKNALYTFSVNSHIPKETVNDIVNRILHELETDPKIFGLEITSAYKKI